MNIVKPVTLVIVALAGLIIGAWLQSRFGPLPSNASTPAPTVSEPVSVTEIRLVEPTVGGDAYRLEATLRRSGPAGVVDVTFRLRNRATGAIFERAAPVQVQPEVALVVVTEISAPRADYAPEVEVKGPTR
jgi:hypothetical protein